MASIYNHISANAYSRYIDLNRRTLDSHKWFGHRFAEADKKQAVLNKVIQFALFNKALYRCMFWFVLVVLLYCNIPYNLTTFGKITFVLLSLSFISFYETKRVDSHVSHDSQAMCKPTVHMIFTRPTLFYQNTHYIFSGTKTDLQRVFEKQRDIIADMKKEEYFGTEDHDYLLDMPLDTFCNSMCDCSNRTAPEANYNCSHWNLHAYDSEEELKKQVRELEKEYSVHHRNGFPNVIIYI